MGAPLPLPAKSASSRCDYRDGDVQWLDERHGLGGTPALGRRGVRRRTVPRALPLRVDGVIEEDLIAVHAPFDGFLGVVKK